MCEVVIKWLSWSSWVARSLSGLDVAAADVAQEAVVVGAFSRRGRRGRPGDLEDNALTIAATSHRSSRGEGRQPRTAPG